MTIPPTTGISLARQVFLRRAAVGLASSDVHASAATVRASAATAIPRKTMAKTIAGLPPLAPAFAGEGWQPSARMRAISSQARPRRPGRHAPPPGGLVLELTRGGGSSGGTGGRQTAARCPGRGPEVL